MPGLLAALLGRIPGAVPVPGLGLVQLPTAPAPRWSSPDPAGEHGFALRDAAADAGFRPADFFGRTVTMDVGVVRRVSPGVYDERSVTIRFDGGRDEDEFWRNYHAALRAAIADTREDFEEEWEDELGDDPGDYYDQTAVVVRSAA